MNSISNNVLNEVINNCEKTKYFYIQDEINMFTFKDGIKKVGKDFYYNSTTKPERGYLTEDIAKEAVKKLMLHNLAGNLGHSFEIISL